MPVVAVFEQEGFVTGAEDPFVAPLSECGEHGPERSALVGEDIVVATACGVVGAPVEQAGVDERVEPVREDVAGDAETFDEVVEAADAEEAVAQDQERPPFTDHLESLGHGAVHVGKGRPAHSPMLAKLHDETQRANMSRMTELRRPGGRSDFERATTITPIPDRPGDFSVELDEGWSSLVGVHGGYMCAGTFSGGDRALVKGYLRPLAGEIVDSSWLAMATDWFPPPAFVRLEPPTGGVSIDLTTHIHRPTVLLGDDEWSTGSFEVKTSTGGTLVAESFQTRLTATD